MPRQKQEGPTRQIYATIREELYLSAKARAAQLRIPMREFLEQALEQALTGERSLVEAPSAGNRSVWNDEYISMQAQRPVGSPVELTEEEARAIASDALGGT